MDKLSREVMKKNKDCKHRQKHTYVYDMLKYRISRKKQSIC